MILLMRHGYTDYLQGNVPVAIEDANDLNEKGIREVTRSSVEITKILKESSGAVIYTSPMGRAIHTAKILKDHLDAVLGVVDLVPAMALQELHNFNWDLYAETVRCSGVDTRGHDESDWPALDLVHKLSARERGRLPANLREFVDCVESVADGKKRLMAFVESTAKTGQDCIYVTHDGLLCPMLMEFTEGAVMSCTRSHYFEIIPTESDLGWALGRTNLELVGE